MVAVHAEPQRSVDVVAGHGAAVTGPRCGAAPRHWSAPSMSSGDQRVFCVCTVWLASSRMRPLIACTLVADQPGKRSRVSSSIVVRHLDGRLQVAERGPTALGQAVQQLVGRRLVGKSRVMLSSMS